MAERAWPLLRRVLCTAAVALLVLASIMSWAVMIQKSRAFKRKEKLNNEFEEYFWSGTSLNDLYISAARNARRTGPMERIFASGMREYQKLRERQVDEPMRLLDSARRAMQASERRELDIAESGMAFLASVGSISPYVGLFGTVWGIMNAFIGISEAQTSSLAVVAPGIAEALLATALGLVAAIPAVIIYNACARWITGYRHILSEVAAGVERLISRDLDFRRIPVEHRLDAQAAE